MRHGRFSIRRCSSSLKPGAAPSLIPDFNFVAIGVSDVGVGIAGAEFASPEQPAASALDLFDGRINVARRNQTEAKVHDAARFAGARRMLVKANDVLAARRPGVDESPTSPVLDRKAHV